MGYSVCVFNYAIYDPVTGTAVSSVCDLGIFADSDLVLSLLPQSYLFTVHTVQTIFTLWPLK